MAKPPKQSPEAAPEAAPEKSSEQALKQSQKRSSKKSQKSGKNSDELLALLASVRQDPQAEGSLAALRQILSSNSAIALAQAAKFLGDPESFAPQQARSLIPELVQAFERLFDQGATTDPNCKAKQRIAEALYHLDYRDASLFLRGIQYRQPEPVWGGSVDTAAALRGTCALGLVRINYPGVLNELADLLADPELEARVGAVRAIAYTGDANAVPLLRLKTHLGDPEPQVLSECFQGLLSLAGEDAVPLVAKALSVGAARSQLEQLRGGEERPSTAAAIAEMAALALGESHLPQALPVLQQWWQGTVDPELRQTGLMAIALLRLDAAIDWLLELVATGNARDRTGAIAALALYQGDPVLGQRVEQARAQTN